MKGINKVILVGTLGKDPDVRYTPNGNAIANFSVATNESWTDKTGQKQERTEWHNIAIFGKLAEICGEYLRKGSSVYLEGKLKTEKWQDQATGQDKYKTVIECREMQMLGGKPSGQNANNQAGGFQQPQQAPQQQAGGFQPQQPQQQQGFQPQQQAPQPQGTPGYGQGGPVANAAPPASSTDFDDDIPF